MRKDSALAEKEAITPKDLQDKPLILSQQESQGGILTQWLGREIGELNIVATYNLLFNASLLVDEGLGYAIGYDKIINTSGDSHLCFRPLAPQLESHMHIIWKMNFTFLILGIVHFFGFYFIFPFSTQKMRPCNYPT